MVKINFNFKDLITAREKFNRLNYELSKNIIIRNGGMSRNIRDHARMLARQGKNVSGKMANGIVSLRTRGGKGFRVISKTPVGARRWNGQGYNVFQEFGIRPNNRYGFVPSIGMVPVGGKVQPHPGAPAKRFMYKTFKWAQTVYPKSMKDTVNNTINKVFKN